MEVVDSSTSGHWQIPVRVLTPTRRGVAHVQCLGKATGGRNEIAVGGAISFGQSWPYAPFFLRVSPAPRILVIAGALLSQKMK